MAATLESIKAAFELEQGKPPKARVLTDVPGSYDAITAEWLTALLCRDVPGSKVIAFEQAGRDDGSSNRRRIFVTYDDAGTKAGLPGSVFCKAAETLQTRILLALADTARSETNFYNKVRCRLNITAPLAYHANFDPANGAYILVMQDLAGKARFCDERTSLNREMASSLVTTLAALHSRFHQSNELGTPTIPFKTWPNWWTDIMAIAPEYASSCDRGFRDAESVIPPRLFKRRAEVWPCTEASVRRHLALPKNLNHTDVHLKNWYITDSGEMGLSDWQLMTIGHWSRDYIYAVSTALTVEQRRLWEKELLQEYLDKMAELGVPGISYDEAWLNCRQQLLSALTFWTITLRPAPGMPDMQPESASYEFIKRIATAMDDLDSMDSFA